MATQWISPTWRMPKNSNQSKVDNYSLDFAGSAKIEYATPVDLGVVSTFSFWMNIDTGTTGALFGNTLLGTYEYVVYYSGSAFYFKIAGAYADFPNAATAISTGQWHHVAFVRPSENEVKCYIDSVLTDTITSWTGTPGSNPIKFDLIGSRPGGGLAYSGKMGQIAGFDSALTSDQITALYNSGTPVNPMALTPLPTAYYPLGGGSTGSSTTLTVPNESVPSATVFNFRGSPIDYITMGNALTKDGSTAFSISCWIKYTGAGTQMIVSKQDASGYGYLLHTGNHAGVKLTWYPCISAGGNVAVRTSSAYNDGNWHNVLATYDGSGNASGAKIYVDGTLDTNIITDTFTGTSSSTGPFQISARNGTSFPFVGDVSNVVVWSSDQNANKDNIYNNGVPQSTYTTTPEAWYKLNVDTSTWDGSDWIIGEAQANYSSALDFDGSTDFITIPSLDLGTTCTFSCWVNFDSFSATTGIVFGMQGSRYVLYAPNSTTIQANFGPNFASGGHAFTVPTMSTGVWYNIVLTKTGANGELFFNGQSQGTTTNFGSNSFTLNFLGCQNQTGATRYYLDGKISNAAVWDSDQSANIANIYNNGTPAVSYTTTPTSWWKLNNLTTGIQDSVGSNNGTNNGAIVEDIQVSTLNGASVNMVTGNLVTSDLTRSIPYSSYSMVFDGTDDNISASGPIVTSGALSFSCWFNTSDTTNNQVIWNGIDSTTAKSFLRITGTALRLKIIDGSGGNNNIDNTVTTADGNWHHIAFTTDGLTTTDGVIVYLDSAPLGTTGTLSNAGFASTTKNQIGSYAPNAQNFNGNLSNPAFFNKVLSQDEILTIYNGGVPNSISSLSPTGWWSLAGDSYFDGTNWICPDLGSGGNNGTSANMAGTELVGDGPGSTANGVATSMDIPANLKGDAPNSTKNSFSINMTEIDRVSGAGNVPG